MRTITKPRSWTHRGTTGDAPSGYRELTNESAMTDGGHRIGAVLLAAGESQRFERGNKLLATVDGTTIVRRAAETLLAADVEDVVAILGYDEAAVRESLEGLDVDLRVNPEFEAGQSTSVREGVAVAREREWDGTVFALGDMPFVAPESVAALLEQYASGNGSIFAAGYEGKRGNPVLFDSEHYDGLADVSGDKGGRELVENHPDARIVETGDPGVTRDVDYEEDLVKYTE